VLVVVLLVDDGCVVVELVLLLLVDVLSLVLPLIDDDRELVGTVFLDDDLFDD
jgi:hypothetical protein